MEIEQLDEVSVETIELQSEFLNRTARIDFYQRNNEGNSEMSLLLLNDGQDVEKMNLQAMMKTVKKPLLIAAIHCGPDRKNEYGMSAMPNADGFGAKAHLYEQFVISELLPFIYSRFGHFVFKETAFAGFSLGALSALDISWNNPAVFLRVGVFSGSLWWRSVQKDDKEYNQDLHRIMHVQVRNSEYRPGMKFFFECGEQDEWEDRNKNGVIDSIDDTIDLMRELVRKGYREGRDIMYLQVPDGKHDVASWAGAMPVFLNWGWGY
ncbi:MAG: esterase [Chitinophagaceae bacterium]|nr:esterase [Chitinophagaceae bacterium]